MAPDAGGQVQRLEALLTELRVEFPGFRVVAKHDSRFQMLLHRLLTVVTFGGQNRYLTDYQTTIGRTVYVTADWDRRSPAERYCILRHEREHIRQFERYGLVGMSILYLLVPFPVGLAWCRARFEWAGYAETIRASAQVYGRSLVESGPFRRRILQQFTGGAYGWMWPFPRVVNRWYDSVIRELP